jgi:hypothetical protein
MQGLAELITAGLVAPGDRLLAAGRNMARLGDLDEMGWAFAVSDEAPYASYEILHER